MAYGVLFDVDGTLVDTNYLHAVAWADAFSVRGHRVAMSDIHQLIGQGSERLVESALGKPDEAAVDAHADIYSARLHRLQVFEGAAKLLRRCKQAGLSVVLATSASQHDAEHFTEAIDADDAIDHITTKDDAGESKPAPDILDAALDATGLDAANCCFVGDTVWDVEAAKRAGMECVCVLTGGIAESDLRAAGAVAIYPNVSSLLADFDASPLGELARRAAS
jgi:phosphoglycolate phosphatase-like HAD superfamily hydrolase